MSTAGDAVTGPQDAVAGTVGTAGAGETGETGGAAGVSETSGTSGTAGAAGLVRATAAGGAKESRQERRARRRNKPKGLTAITEPIEDLRLPVWYFGFEAVFASAFDLIKAFPSCWPVLVLLIPVNLAVSFTVLRKRLRLAGALWRGKETRKLAIGLLVLRLGSHFALNAVGVTVTGRVGHLLFAVAMGAVTVTLLAYTQRTALRALEKARAAQAAVADGVADAAAAGALAAVPAEIPAGVRTEIPAELPAEAAAVTAEPVGRR
ncbi:hypothetical protein ACFW1A_28825 [Kitasatospora sp. NPDC058965]|uniref:hypothetical protein n=1 Tax=Kitasatospora sp. NPDC058965 TaxID=3346682 RepID=UPI0036C73EAC